MSVCTKRKSLQEYCLDAKRLKFKRLQTRVRNTAKNSYQIYIFIGFRYLFLSCWLCLQSCVEPPCSLCQCYRCLDPTLLMFPFKNKFYCALLKKARRNTGAQHVAAGKFRHPRRSSGPIYVDDGFFRSIYVDDRTFPSPAWCDSASRLAFVTACIPMNIRL
jgi:hypothetical protein